MHPQAEKLDAACDYLRQHPDKVPTLAEIGRAVHLSPFTLQRLFQQILGISPREYHAAQRSKLLRQKLKNTAPGTITDAIYAAGYGSSSRVYEQAAHTIGMTPTQYRSRGLGLKIRFSIGASALGDVLVATTERGICAVTLGDSKATLEAELRDEFPGAEIYPDDAGLTESLRAVLTHFSEHPVSLALPLDVRATAFQHRVWKALQQIPRGQTRSYSDVAAAIGQPTAVRAVARACAQNPVAVLVPCHRVVGSNGKLTGYRWGVERKRQLLSIEAAL